MLDDDACRRLRALDRRARAPIPLPRRKAAHKALHAHGSRLHLAQTLAAGAQTHCQRSGRGRGGHSQAHSMRSRGEN
jgi:hypothetical protein